MVACTLGTDWSRRITPVPSWVGWVGWDGWVGLVTPLTSSRIGWVTPLTSCWVGWVTPLSTSRIGWTTPLTSSVGRWAAPLTSVSGSSRSCRSSGSSLPELISIVRNQLVHGGIKSRLTRLELARLSRLSSIHASHHVIEGVPSSAAGVLICHVCTDLITILDGRPWI
jgi:hypothetical protein